MIPRFAVSVCGGWSVKGSRTPDAAHSENTLKWSQANGIVGVRVYKLCTCTLCEQCNFPLLVPPDYFAVSHSRLFSPARSIRLIIWNGLLICHWPTRDHRRRRRRVSKLRRAKWSADSSPSFRIREWSRSWDDFGRMCPLFSLVLIAVGLQRVLLPLVMKLQAPIVQLHKSILSWRGGCHEVQGTARAYVSRSQDPHEVLFTSLFAL